MLELAEAQNFPSRPITVIVPYPEGFALDYLPRAIEGKMERALGQSLIIENKPGELGNIGNSYVAKAAPDGYTLAMTAVNIGVFPYIYSKMAYNPLTDFAGVGQIAETPGVCIVNTASRFQTFGDLMREAKENPRRLKFGSASTGAPSHLIVELIAKLNDVKFTHVPYTHAQYSSAAVLDNSVDFTCNGLVGMLPLIRDGKVRALAVTSARRSRVLPEVPTVNEAGFGDVDENSRHILLAPARTPTPVLDVLSTALTSVLEDPAIQDDFIKHGFDLDRVSPAQVITLIQKQHDLWGPFIKELNLKPD
jgi:tripartite-type tricarboxylate transporter receptor subunit TctC